MPRPERHDWNINHRWRESVCFFKNMFTGTVTGNVDYAAPGSIEWGVTAAYIHTEHVSMISLSSGGVVKED